MTAARRIAWLCDLPILLGAAATLVLLLYTFSLRVSFPFDLEFFEGSMMAQAHRALAGKSLYPEPSLTWIGLLYPPLYSWVVAGISSVTGLDYWVGRSVSLAGTLAATLALVAAVRRETGDVVAGLASGALFLSCYDEVGSFFDLVRGDGLLIALIGGSLYFVRFGRIRLGAMLLVLAFATKQSAAVLGLPAALWLYHTQGWRRAGEFVAFAAVPALIFVGVMQLATQSWFLVYLIEAPRTHQIFWWTLFPTSPSYLVQALPWATTLTTLGLASAGMDGRPRQAAWIMLAVLGIIAAGVLAGPWLHGIVAPSLARSVEQTDLGLNLAAFLRSLVSSASNIRFVLLCALLVPLGLFFGLHRHWSEGAGYWGLQAATLIAFSLLMRAHVGGYVNVFIPGFWAVALVSGLALAALRRHFSQPLLRLAMAGIVAWQLWAGSWDPQRYAPTQRDLDAGNSVAKRIEAVDGEVLAPYQPFLPLRLGKGANFSMVALHDITHPSLPFRSVRDDLDRSFRMRRWGAVLLPARPGWGESFELSYPTVEHLIDDATALDPKVGMSKKPALLYMLGREGAR